jgi:hypothetical protein
MDVPEYRTNFVKADLIASSPSPSLRLSNTAGNQTLNMVYANAIAPQMIHIRITVLRQRGANSLPICTLHPLSQLWIAAKGPPALLCPPLDAERFSVSVVAASGRET